MVLTMGATLVSRHLALDYLDSLKNVIGGQPLRVMSEVCVDWSSRTSSLGKGRNRINLHLIRFKHGTSWSESRFDPTARAVAPMRALASLIRSVHLKRALRAACLSGRTAQSE